MPADDTPLKALEQLLLRISASDDQLEALMLEMLNDDTKLVNFLTLIRNSVANPESLRETDPRLLAFIAVLAQKQAHDLMRLWLPTFKERWRSTQS